MIPHSNSSLAIFNSLQNFLTTSLTRRLYSLQPQLVNPLQARTFAVWTLASAFIRLYAAYNITLRPYVLAPSSPPEMTEPPTKNEHQNVRPSPPLLRPSVRSFPTRISGVQNRGSGTGFVEPARGRLYVFLSLSPSLSLFLCLLSLHKKEKALTRISWTMIQPPVWCGCGLVSSSSSSSSSLTPNAERRTKENRTDTNPRPSMNETQSTISTSSKLEANQPPAVSFSLRCPSERERRRGGGG